MAEQLEERLMMSAGDPVSLVGGVLSVHGTDEADTILVKDVAAGQVSVSVNGTSQVFSGPIERIQAFGYQGNDKMYLNTSLRVLAYGHEGDDTIRGGKGYWQANFKLGPNEPVVTIEDNPVITEADVPAVSTGNGSGNVLVGGPGDDEIWGGDGDDTIYGGAGRDEIHGLWGDDKLYGDENPPSVVWSLGAAGWYQVTEDVNLLGLVPKREIVDGSHLVVVSVYNRIVTATTTEGRTFELAVIAKLQADCAEIGPALDGMLPEFTGDENAVDQRIVLDEGTIPSLVFRPDDNIWGGDGDDYIYGGGGYDELHGEGGSDHVYGEDGEDYILGGEGDDILYGGHEDDGIDCGDGNDLARGGDGDDVIYGLEGDDTITGNGGDDEIWGGDGNDHLSGNDGDDTILGDSGNPQVSGGNDVIVGGSGNDDLRGGGGEDWIYGWAGDDTIDGGYGADFIDGGDGLDRIHGGGHDDEIHGGGGPDDIYGDTGEDHLYGGSGDDDIDGGDDRDYLYGESGDDDLYGHSGDDCLIGGPGDDCLAGGTGLDGLFAHQGDDRVPDLESRWADSDCDRIYVDSYRDAIDLDGLSGRRGLNALFSIVNHNGGQIDHLLGVHPGGVLEAGYWTLSELSELDDVLLGVEAVRCSGAAIQRGDGVPLSFSRGGSWTGPEAGWNYGGLITLTDNAFTSARQFGMSLVRLLAQNWVHDEPMWSAFLAVSDWTYVSVLNQHEVQAKLNAGYKITTKYDQTWIYNPAVNFYGAEGDDHPRDDWGMTWVAYFYGSTTDETMDPCNSWAQNELGLKVILANSILG